MFSLKSDSDTPGRLFREYSRPKRPERYVSGAGIPAGVVILDAAALT
jgi:hypothetical protein